MSGSPGGLRAVPSVAAASSVGAASGPRKASRGGGQRHSRIPFCSSGLQAGCGRTSQGSTRQTDIQQRVSAAQRVPGPARHLGALDVTLPTGCLQPVGLAPAVVARGPACCSAPSKKRTFKVNTVHLSTEPRDPASRRADAWHPNIDFASVQAFKWTVLHLRFAGTGHLRFALTPRSTRETVR